MTEALKWNPETFGGEDDRWRDWSRVFRSWSGRFYKGQLHVVMDIVEKNKDVEAKVEDLDLRGLLANNGGEATLRQMAAELYHTLILLTRGRALRTLLTAGDGEGFEAWRLLIRRYEPSSSATQGVDS